MRRSRRSWVYEIHSGSRNGCGTFGRQEGELGLSKPKGRPRKRQDEQSELEFLRMENALLKKFHAELRKQELAKRNIG